MQKRKTFKENGGNILQAIAHETSQITLFFLKRLGIYAHYKVNIGNYQPDFKAGVNQVKCIDVREV